MTDTQPPYRPKPIDADILAAMAASIMTYVITNILEYERGYKNLETPTVLRRLKILERAGKVRRAKTSYAIMLCWALV